MILELDGQELDVLEYAIYKNVRIEYRMNSTPRTYTEMSLEMTVIKPKDYYPDPAKVLFNIIVEGYNFQISSWESLGDRLTFKGMLNVRS